mmetsp:Transcript_17837/g.29668  ORF Transcript_17837/g.29668 Transcript_17837/m.29668 type:complete len:493 (+) Transcript_17837:58-1536(+)
MALACVSHSEQVQLPSGSGSTRLGTPSHAACKTPSNMDFQSPLASFFGENCRGFQRSTPRVSFCVEDAAQNIGSTPCKSPKTTYFDENCHAWRPCKSPMSAYFDGDDLSFNMDSQAMPSATPQLMPALVHGAPLVASCVQMPALPTLLQSARFFCQTSSSTHHCAQSAHNVMQQTCHISSAWQQTKPAASTTSQIDDLQKQEARTSPQMLPREQAANSERSRRVSWADEVSEEDICSLPVLGNVWRLSQDPAGCRKVQTYIDEAVDEAQCIAVAIEFEGYISEAAQCPHANHALRKLIDTLSSPSLQSMIDELVRQGPETVSELCRHRYGCRIVEGLLIHCTAEQTQPLVSILLPQAYDLCMHMYGNFVMQRIVENGSDSVRQDIFRLLQVHVASLGTNFYGSAVIGTCMRFAGIAGQLTIARALISVDGLLATLERFKHAKAAAHSVLGLLSGEELKDAHRQLYEATPLKVEKIKKAAGRAVVARRKSASA